MPPQEVPSTVGAGGLRQPRPKATGLSERPILATPPLSEVAGGGEGDETAAAAPLMLGTLFRTYDPKKINIATEILKLSARKPVKMTFRKPTAPVEELCEAIRMNEIAPRSLFFARRRCWSAGSCRPRHPAAQARHRATAW